MCAGLLFFRQEVAPQNRPRSQYPEEIGGHHRNRKLLGPAAAGQRETGAPVRRHAVERTAPGAPVEIVRVAERLIGIGRQPRRVIGLLQPYQPLRVRKGQRPKHHGIDQAEDCGRSSNAERQSADHHHGEAGVLAKLAESQTKVAQQERHDVRIVSSNCPANRRLPVDP